MAEYIINKNKDNQGNNEIHNISKVPSCQHLPIPANRVSLGFRSSDKEALSYAKQIGWKNADGCFHCCKDAHTK